jgi:hypothetical protein
MADLAELRATVVEAVGRLEHVVDAVLGISGDIDELADEKMDLTPSLADELEVRTKDARASASALKASYVQLVVRVGNEHPLAMAFQLVMHCALAASDALPDQHPSAEQQRTVLHERWGELGDAHRVFLEMAVEYTGVRLGGQGARHPVLADNRFG